jgi:N-acetylmuramoyl-L-alanine amidase
LLRDAVRVTIELDAEVPFHDERLDDPARVFVDLSNTRAAPRLIDRTIRFDGDADLVRQIRVGRHPNKTTRVVLDAAHVASYSVYPLYDPYRLVIDCVRKTDGRLTASAEASPFDGAQGVPSDRRGAAIEKPDATNGTTSAHQPTPVASAFSRTGPLPARSLIGLLIRRPPAVIPHATAAIADPRSDEVRLKRDTTDVTLKPEPTADVSPARPAPNPGRGFSMARQLGLGVSRIVIDAGHGGHDPGAQGRGITEAELVLDVALRLEALLERAPGVEVILTRRSDEFIALQERTAIANREGADLFLSIHANASRSPQARGVETYFLNFASNLSAASVAARENAASGHAMGALPDLVKAIALNNKLDESRDFAAQIQRAMLERLRGANRTVKDLGVKQAPFVVLIGAAMPSVLAEISFVTNPQEARLLKSGAYRQRIAEALFNAIRKYQSSLKSAVAVAHQ